MEHLMMPLLFAFSCIPCALIEIAILLGETKPKGDVVLGTEVPAHLRYSQEYETHIEWYRSRLKKSIPLLILSYLPAFFIPSDSLSLTYIMVWVLAAVLTPLFFIAKANKRLRQMKAAHGADTSDDRHWLWGIFYRNPADSRTFVIARINEGRTVNMARLPGKILAVFLIFCLLAVPVLCIWMIAEEYVPLRLTLKEDTLLARQWKTDYEIPLEEIDEIQLLHEADLKGKVYGSAVGEIAKGVFHTGEYGKCRVFLDQRNTNILALRAGEEWYLLNGKDPEGTRKLYESLQDFLALAG